MSDFESFETRVNAFTFEVLGLLEQLEQHLLDSENNVEGLIPFIDECFRLMHSIKSLAEMMNVSNVAELSHRVEDLFSFLRKMKSVNINNSLIIDNVLDAIDFIRNELLKIQKNQFADGDNQDLIKNIDNLLDKLNSSTKKNKTAIKNKLPVVKGIDYTKDQNKETETPNTIKYKYNATIFFEDNCQMENIRAGSIIYDIQEFADIINCYPEDPLKNDDSIDIIKKEGFSISFKTSLDIEAIKEKLSSIDCIKKLDITPSKDSVENMSNSEETSSEDSFNGESCDLHSHKIKIEEIAEVQKFVTEQIKAKNMDEAYSSSLQKMSAAFGENIKSIISVNVEKLDKLMDLVGQLVITESMLTEAPELQHIKSRSLKKTSRTLRKLIVELREIVMSTRMVSFEGICNKLNRIIRDMSRKLNKKIQFIHTGDETEVDKTIIEMITEPLIHIIRNAVDHGIETPSERLENGKNEIGSINLEIKNTGEEILISIKDDGKGLDKEKILEKAIKLGFKLNKDFGDQELYSLVFLPGFSTKENVSEYSGRGVGMDVVRNNIDILGGEMTINSNKGIGTITNLKIPLTLSIIKGLTVIVSNSKFTIPLSYVKETLKVRLDNLIADDDDNEIIIIKEKHCPLIKINKYFNLDTNQTKTEQGIVVLVEYRGETIGLLVDKIYGEHQIVVKSLPKYLRSIKSISGCSIFSDGSISLILNIAELIKL